jgi:hypothetical protein
MKKLSIIVCLQFFVFGLMVLINCDDLQTIPLNVPYSQDIFVSGTDTNISDSSCFCLDDALQYVENSENIEELTYVKAQLRVDNASSGLEGDVVVSLYGIADCFSNTKTLLFSVTIPNAKAADFIGKNYVIELSQAQINALNQYLANPNALCFVSELAVLNISGGTSPFELWGIVEIVIEAIVKL